MPRNTKIPPDLVDILDRTFLVDILKRMEDLLRSTEDQVSSLISDIGPLADEAMLPQAYREAYAKAVEFLRPVGEAANRGFSAIWGIDAFRKPGEIAAFSKPLADHGKEDANPSAELIAAAKQVIDGLNTAEANLLETVEKTLEALEAMHAWKHFDREQFPSGYCAAVVLDPGKARRCYANHEQRLLRLQTREYSPFLPPDQPETAYSPDDGHPLHGCRLGRLAQSMIEKSPLHYHSVREYSPLTWQLLPFLHEVEIEVLSMANKVVWAHGVGDVTS